MDKSSPTETIEIEISHDSAAGPVRLLIDGEVIARILLSWGASPRVAGGAATDVLVYLSGVMRGAPRLQ
jgi:hypothetical protein